MDTCYKKWKKGDVVEVNLPMETKLIRANENLKDDIGKVAVERGPLVYCAEWKDNNGKAANIILPINTTFRSEFKSDLLNGVEVLQTVAPTIQVGNDGRSISTVDKTITLIPYYAWANRGEGEMMIWFPSTIKDLDLLSSNELDRTAKPK